MKVIGDRSLLAFPIDYSVQKLDLRPNIEVLDNEMDLEPT